MANYQLSDEDKALFRQMVQTVKLLKKATHNKIIATQRLPTMPVERLSSIQKDTALVVKTLHLSSYYTEEIASHTTLSFCTHTIPKKRILALRQGQITWQSYLDLHGFRPEDAQHTLVDFILNASQKNYRCLLIIHGKSGIHGKAPILKNLVNCWLKQIPQVLAFHSALPKDGGTGALYVLLKRHRNLT
jgi:DNA-nicking Smr family endonuclease